MKGALRELSLSLLAWASSHCLCPPGAGSSQPPRRSGAPEVSSAWSRSLSFMALTLPWGHLAEGFHRSSALRSLTDPPHFLLGRLIIPSANQAHGVKMQITNRGSLQMLPLVKPKEYPGFTSLHSRATASFPFISHNLAGVHLTKERAR